MGIDSPGIKSCGKISGRYSYDRSSSIDSAITADSAEQIRGTELVHSINNTQILNAHPDEAPLGLSCTK